MRTRITVRHIDAAIARLNRITANHPEPWVRSPEGGIVASVGTYFLSRSPSGYAMHQHVTECGAVRDPLWVGSLPLRALHERIAAYTCGVEDATDKLTGAAIR